MGTKTHGASTKPSLKSLKSQTSWRAVAGEAYIRVLRQKEIKDPQGHFWLLEKILNEPLEEKTLGRLANFIRDQSLRLCTDIVAPKKRRATTYDKKKLKDREILWDSAAEALEGLSRDLKADGDLRFATGVAILGSLLLEMRVKRFPISLDGKQFARGERTSKKDLYKALMVAYHNQRKHTPHTPTDAIAYCMRQISKIWKAEGKTKLTDRQLYLLQDKLVTASKG